MDEKPRFRSVDFSYAHFLDHSIWKCRRGPSRVGGWRRHLFCYLAYKRGLPLRDRWLERQLRKDGHRD